MNKRSIGVRIILVIDSSKVLYLAEQRVMVKIVGIIVDSSQEIPDIRWEDAACNKNSWAPFINDKEHEFFVVD